MRVGNYDDLTDIREGMQYMRQVFNGTLAVVTRMNIIHIPEADVAQLSTADLTYLHTRRWLEHSVEGGMFFSLGFVPGVSGGDS